MATQTPKPEDEIHSEEIPKPIPWGEGSLNRNSTAKGSASFSGGGWGSGSSLNSNSTGGVSREDLGAREANPESGASTAVGDKEKSLQDRMGGVNNSTQKGSWSYSNEGGRRNLLNGTIRNFTRRRVVTVAITGTVLGGGIFSMSILSGPFQFIHFAQNIQKHFASNEEFGNDRSSKVLLYALTGRGAQNGRLGVAGNYAANRWETRLVRETGMRPVYQEPGRRFVGFEIVDDNKAQNILGDLDERNNRTSNRRIERSMGRGADIKTGEGRALVNSRNQSLGSSTRFLD